jgi:hypothetical protein
MEQNLKAWHIILDVLSFWAKQSDITLLTELSGITDCKASKPTTEPDGWDAEGEHERLHYFCDEDCL